MERRTPNRWVILAMGLFAQAASCSFLYGLPFLIPALRAAKHLSLAQAGAVAAAPVIGLTLALIAWGAAADRYGERSVMALGLGVSGVLVLVAVLTGVGLVPFTLLLGVAGAGAASVNAASGRVVLGWFEPHERGRAMAVRQTAQPLGVAMASAALPALAHGFGFETALLFPAALSVLAAAMVALFVVDPPRPVRKPGDGKPRSPYHSPILFRLHGASTLLVIPQFAISAFSLDYLVTQQQWAPQLAGAVLAVFQLAGAAGRIGAGWWSDRAGSRLRPMRLLAVASAGVLLLFALGDSVSPVLAVVALALGAMITVADNGLAFASVAEIAGPFWAGRALGAQNTAQNIAASLTPPLLGAAIGTGGYAWGFTLAAVFPLVAIAATPVAAERVRTSIESG
jgi:sugar phosphate permease